MSDRKMHDNEIAIDELLVKNLLSEQFPQWKKFPLSRVKSDGTDNAVYRLGTDMCVRLPRVPGAASLIEKEQQWLPELAPTLPLAIPVILGKGMASLSYIYPWSIFNWLEGENAAVEKIIDLNQAAIDLAEFLIALQKINPAGGPPSRRGVPLIMQDAEVRCAIESLHGAIDTEIVTKIWKECLQAPEWDKPPVWTHGDLLPANLLVQQGKLSGVIDFGCLGIGDPACDLIVAWSVLDSESRDVFRTRLKVDDATWVRGRGWALSISLIIIPYYKVSNPGLVAVANRMIREIIADISTKNDK